VLVFGIAPTHTQDLALGLVELHAVHAGPPLQPVKVPKGFLLLEKAISPGSVKLKVLAYI